MMKALYFSDGACRRLHFCHANSKGPPQRLLELSLCYNAI
jgi:hypothetical protein